MSSSSKSLYYLSHEENVIMFTRV